MKKEITANQLNKLGQEAIKEIKQRKSFFTTITMVFPNKRTGDFFKSFWLKNNDEVLLNIEYKTIDEILPTLIETEKRYQILKKQQMFSFVLEELSSFEEKDCLPSFIKNYLLNENKAGINQQKLYDLSSTLTSLFLEYENNQTEISDYQKEIYDRVITKAKNYNMTTLSTLFRERKGFIKKENLIFFGFSSLNNLSKTIIDEYSKEYDFSFYELILDEKVQIPYHFIKAPSMIREVEALHSQICTILHNNKDISFSDFLVIVPSINEYESTIRRVFLADDKSFPSIPFSINDKEKMESEITSALNILYNSVALNSYTRDDFMSLVTNKMIDKVRGISEEESKAFRDTILNMEVYRELDNRFDFDYAKKRLLLSLVSSINDEDENIIELKGKEYLPYSSIDMNKDSIVKFIKIIDDLKSFKETMTMVHETKITPETYKLIINEYDKWFSIKDDFGNETNGQYKKLLNSLKSFSREEIASSNISLESFVYFAKEESKIKRTNSSEYFSSGITFTSFDKDAILYSKYVFFLNAGSTSLPSKKVVSELDLRNKEEILSNAKELERKAFFLTYQNCEEFYISYINKDTKTDEELYPSTFLLDLSKKFNSMDGEKGLQIPLDETRDNSLLFTKKEITDKGYFNNLTSDSDIESIDETSGKLEYEVNVKLNVNNLRDFLLEPLSFKTKALFGYHDNKDEEIKNKFEPFKMMENKVTILSRKIAIELLKNDHRDFSKDENINYESYEGLKTKLNLQHKIPDINEPINESNFRKILKEAIDIQKEISINSNNLYEIEKLQDLPLHYEDKYNKDYNVTWVLTCKDEICHIKSNNAFIYYAYKKQGNMRDIMQLYIISLMEIASLNTNPSYEYDITLNAGKKTNKAKEIPISKSFKLSTSKAKEILNNIFYSLNDYTVNYYLPLFPSKDINNYYDLITIFLSERYFDDKDLFDIEKDLGYDQENFQAEIKERIEKVKSYILFDLDDPNKSKKKDEKEKD